MKSVWHDVHYPRPQDWLSMAQDCHARDNDWAMYLALLLWAINREDCEALGVCQGYKPPCVDCPQKL